MRLLKMLPTQKTPNALPLYTLAAFMMIACQKAALVSNENCVTPPDLTYKLKNRVCSMVDEIISDEAQDQSLSFKIHRMDDYHLTASLIVKDPEMGVKTHETGKKSIKIWDRALTPEMIRHFLQTLLQQSKDKL